MFVTQALTPPLFDESDKLMMFYLHQPSVMNAHISRSVQGLQPRAHSNLIMEENGRRCTK